MKKYQEESRTDRVNTGGKPGNDKVKGGIEPLEVEAFKRRIKEGDRLYCYRPRRRGDDEVILEKMSVIKPHGHIVTMAYHGVRGNTYETSMTWGEAIQLNRMTQKQLARELARMRNEMGIVTISGKSQPLILMNVRTNDKEEFAWTDLQGILHRLITEETAEACWNALYEEPYPPAEEEKEAQRQRKAEAERKAEEKRKAQEAEEREKARQAEVQRIQKDKERQEREAAAKKQAVAPVQPEPQAASEPKEESQEEPKEAPREEPQETGTFPMPEPQEDTPKSPQEAVQMEVEDYPGVVPEKYITCHDGTQVIKPMESLRDEGCRLADEVTQWMRTGTMEYARETQRNIARLGEIIKEMLQDEERD